MFPETKTNEEKEIFKDVLRKEILSRKRQRKRDFRKVVMLWIFTFSYNTATAFLDNSILLPENTKNSFL